IVFTWIPFLIICFFLYRQACISFEERIMGDMESTAQLQATRVNNLLDSYISDAQLVAANRDIQSMNAEKVHSALEDFSKRWRQYVAVKVFKADSFVLAESNKPLGGTPRSVAAYDFFQEGLKGPYLSDIFLSGGGEGLVMVSAVPITVNGRTVGVVSPGMTTTDLSSLISEAKIGQTGDVYLINRKGYFITPSRFSKELKENGIIKNRSELELYADSRGAKEVLAGKAGVGIYKDSRGREVVGAYAPINHAGWGLLIEQDSAEAFEKLLQLRNVMLLIAIIFTGLIIIGVMFLSKKITSGLVVLTNATQNLLSGDTQVLVDIDSSDEIGRLSKSFNKMAARIKTLLGDLEQQVAVQTATNEQLQREISGRVRMEEALRVSETKFRTIYNKTFDAIMLLTEKGFFDCNPRTLELFGFKSKEDFIKVHPSEVSPQFQPDGTDSLTASLERIKVAYARGFNRFEWIHRRTSGEDFPAEVMLSAIKLEDEFVLIATVRDIAERKKAEDALKESERRFHAIFDQTFQFIGLMKIDGTLIQANRAALEFSSIEESEVLGKPFWDGPWWKHSKELRQQLQEAVKRAAAGEFTRFDATHPALDGTLRDVDFSLKPVFDEEGGIIFLIPEGRDVTELRDTQRDLHALNEELEQRVITRTVELQIVNKELEQAKEAAEAASRVKGEFLAKMSHEIRTPMNAIIGFSGLMSKLDMTVRQRDYLDKIASSAKSLLGIIDDILDFSKIAANKLTIELIEFCLDEVVNSVTNLLSVPASEKGIKLICSTTGDIPDLIKGDPLRLGQVLNNLVGNAVKFTDSGHVLLKVELVGKATHSCLIRFTVQDTGVGMAPEQTALVLDAFVQAESSVTRRYGGTGLGLTISSHLLRLMGSELEVESEPGKGTIFTFTLELGYQEETGSVRNSLRHVRSGETLPELIKKLKGTRILLVEDNLLNQEIAFEILKEAGIIVETALTGREALEKLSGRSYDVVLMDIEMPVMGGY
ncbi:MAG: PAS domain S-box protein, partial [Victivallales bacterium]